MTVPCEPTPDATTDPTTATVVRAAEALLSRRSGGTVRLTDAEDLGGSDRTVVLRVRPRQSPYALPRTLVVKQVRAPRDPDGGSAEAGQEAFLREAVSYQFANSLPLRHRPGATLVAHDLADRVLVLGDLGTAPTLADVVADPDPATVRRGLTAWAQALGRMHAATAGREDDFAALLRRTGRTRWTDPLAGSATDALARVPAALEAATGVPTPQEVRERAGRTAHLLGRGGYRAFSPADLCPDNAVLSSEGVQFLDFEGGAFRDVVLDAACALVPFPACWCSPHLGAELTEGLVQAWRAEVVAAFPRLADDAVLRARLFDAQLLWTWISTWWFLPPHPARRAPSSEHQLALPPAQALALRWAGLAGAAERAGEPATAAHARAVAAALTAAGHH